MVRVGGGDLHTAALFPCDVNKHATPSRYAAPAEYKLAGLSLSVTPYCQAGG